MIPARSISNSSSRTVSRNQLCFSSVNVMFGDTGTSISVGPGINISIVIVRVFGRDHFGPRRECSGGVPFVKHVYVENSEGFSSVWHANLVGDLSNFLLWRMGLATLP